MTGGGPVLGSRFEQALVYATQIHGGQFRKGTSVPYVAHLLGVCALVLEDGGSEDEAIAALLHDAVEDQGGAERLEDIRSRFGERVAKIVEACTDAVERTGLSSEERKRMAIAALPGKDESALRVSLADKLYNARAMLRDYREVGDELWSRFNVGRDGQLDYYRQLSDGFGVLTDGPMANELGRVVSELERAAGDRPSSSRASLTLDGFAGFETFELLGQRRCADVPAEPGVYVVLHERDELPVFLDESVGGHFKGRNPTVKLTELETNWVSDAPVLYIGKASNLRRRLDQFAAFGHGRPVGHWGGRLIWQLANSQQLRVAWHVVEPTMNPEVEERRLLGEFVEAYGRLPFANLR